MPRAPGAPPTRRGVHLLSSGNDPTPHTGQVCHVSGWHSVERLCCHGVRPLPRFADSESRGIRLSQQAPLRVDLVYPPPPHHHTDNGMQPTMLYRIIRQPTKKMKMSGCTLSLFFMMSEGYTVTFLKKINLFFHYDETVFC